MTLQKSKVRIPAAFALAALLSVAVTAGSSSPASAQQTSQPMQMQMQTQSASTNSSSQLMNAQQISETNSMTVDPDVKTLVITIPDNAGTGNSMWEGFLPSNATVAAGTVVVVLNADVNAIHRITMSGGANQSATNAVPYQNTTAYRLDALGQYTLTDGAAQISGTINVVDNTTLTDDPITNASRSAVGLFIAPASAKSNFESHLNQLGFNAVSTFNFSGTQNASMAETTTANVSDNTTASSGNTTAAGSGEMTLFVWTQQVAHPNTIDGRLASKVGILEEILYPNDAVKQNNALPTN